MAIRNILHDGDETLLKISKPVREINARVLEQIKDMGETLYAAGNGIGLAAPQVGLLKRIFVIDMNDGAGLQVFINPEITATEGEQTAMEGCLSVPGMFGSVCRPAKVKVKATNEQGENFEVVAEGLYAVCICHENDHLDGILFKEKVIGDLVKAEDLVDEED